MLHPELALIPRSVVSDFVLTLVGTRLYGGTSDGRAAYERSARYRDIVVQPRTMPVRLELRYVLVAALLVLMGATRHTAIGGTAYAVLLGVLIGAYALINGAPIANILALHQHNKDGGPVTERRRQSSAAYRHFGSSFLPLGILAARTPGPISLGVALGGLFLAVTHLSWALASPASAPASPPAVRPSQQQAGQSYDSCRRPAAQVPVLIAGKTADICSECVATSAAVLAERAAASVPTAT